MVKNAPADLSLDAAVAISGLSEKTIRLKIQAGELPAFRVGRALHIEPDELNRWMASRRIPVVPAWSR